MRMGLKWMLFGLLSLLLFLYFSLNQSILIIPAQNSIFLALTLILIITGIFEYRREYYNRTLYLIMITLILIICFLSPTSAYKGNTTTYYLLFGVVTSIIIAFAYEFTHRMKIYQETVQIYNKTLKTNPQDTTAWNNKGATLISIKEYQEAIECFDKALKIDPKDAAALHNKGISLEKLGKQQEAIKYYDQALAQDPKFEQSKKDGKIIIEN